MLSHKSRPDVCACVCLKAGKMQPGLSNREISYKNLRVWMLVSVLI